MHLSSNYDLSDINILEKVNFKELKELDLSWNNISNIEVLEKVKFEKLEKLLLFGNNIDEIRFAPLIENLNSRFEVDLNE